MLISDTRFSTDPDFERKVKNEWEGEILFSSLDADHPARGVALFFRKNLVVEICEKFSHVSGNFVSCVIKYDNKNILIGCMYGPNEDNRDFYLKISCKTWLIPEQAWKGCYTP